MKIREIIEAIGTIGSSTDPQQDGLPKTGNNPNPTSQQKQSGPNPLQQNAQIKSSVTNIKNILQKGSGANIDVNKLSQTLATQAPGQPMDPMSMKSLQAMIPAVADALKNPQAATSLKTALQTGSTAQTAQQVRQAQQDKEEQK